jgi:hypothetical protein
VTAQHTESSDRNPSVNAHNPSATTDLTELAPLLTMHGGTSLMPARQWQFRCQIAMETQNQTFGRLNLDRSVFGLPQIRAHYKYQ